MTELSFLISLLLNDELPINIKQLVANRIKEVEANIVTQPIRQNRIVQQIQPHIEEQPMQNNPVVAQALAARQQAIAQSISGKSMPGETSPNKMRGQL